jgi:hypothetical protein
MTNKRIATGDVFRDESFTWEVAVAGYQWDGPYEKELEFHPRRPKLVEVNPGGGRKKSCTYAPLDVLDLFERFASTEETLEGIKHFANQWGPLIVEAGDPDESSFTGDDDEYCEMLWIWQSCIRNMRTAVHLWRLAMAEDRAGLKKVLKPANEVVEMVDDWVDDGDTRPRNGWGCIIPHSTIGNLVAHVYPHEDVLVASWLAVNDWINAHLHLHCCPNLKWDWEHKKSTVRISPKNLVGAMWLQFAQRVIGEVRIRLCKICGKQIKIAREKGGRRADRELCSAACRQANQRQRVKEAHRLHGEGLTPLQIANQMGARIAVINNWISKMK